MLCRVIVREPVGVFVAAPNTRKGKGNAAHKPCVLFIVCGSRFTEHGPVAVDDGVLAGSVGSVNNVLKELIHNGRIIF